MQASDSREESEMDTAKSHKSRRNTISFGVSTRAARFLMRPLSRPSPFHSTLLPMSVRPSANKQMNNASGGWAKKTRRGLVGNRRGGSTNHGVSTTLSHERQAHVDLEKTLLNDDAGPMDYDDGDGSGDVDVERRDVEMHEDEDDEHSMFNWDSEQSLLRDLMDEGYDLFFSSIYLLPLPRRAPSNRYPHRCSGFSTPLNNVQAKNDPIADYMRSSSSFSFWMMVFLEFAGSLGFLWPIGRPNDTPLCGYLGHPVSTMTLVFCSPGRNGR
ncbi:hypothetical protein FA13DRAFT_1122505 [Coprinellus micaceus]|uniref:Uncharacterized protein n=1 Tax=Coprinellus micaceus TaxID=71717 RepID=A0A4Y7SXI6_COPMI|nr:hypothetical protein FA13DRAFT_1122505 [Coprinellus micaceus]